MERSYGQLRIDQGHIEAERATKRSTQNVDVNKPQLTHLFAENREAKAQKVAETAPTDTAEAAKAAVDGTTAKPKLGQKRTFDDATGGKTKSTKKGAISKKEVAPAVRGKYTPLFAFGQNHTQVYAFGEKHTPTIAGRLIIPEKVIGQGAQNR